jgi:hypothetical protein
LIDDIQLQSHPARASRVSVTAMTQAGPGAPERHGLAWLACLVVLLAGCAATVYRQTPELRRAEGMPTIVVMPFDVELAALTAFGLQEPRGEWTAAALKHMRSALEEEARRYGVRLIDYQPELGVAEDRQMGLELIRLHRAVGSAVLLHHYSPGLELPNKGERFDWSLGPAVSAIARTHHADYALFLFVRDSYASAGRVAVMVVGALFGIGISGGAQIGFASVVDLKNGDIVWFNRVTRARGDLRTPDSAAETVRALVSDSLK